MTGDLVTGYIAVLICVIFYGINFVPAKKVNYGDGIAFQFIMCTGIWVTSLPVLILQKSPPFHMTALLGGFIWTTGNTLTFAAVKLNGLGLSILLWGSSCMMAGWLTGKMGLFGLHRNTINNTLLNYCGVGLCLLGLLVFLQLKPSQNTSDSPKNDMLSVNDVEGNDVNVALLQDDKLNKLANDNITYSNCDANEDELFQGLSPSNKRIIGSIFALMAGLFFGSSFDFAQYINDTEYDGNDNNLNYVFIHFTGILLCSWIYFMIYCCYKTYYSKTAIYCKADQILPATLSGVVWGIACIFQFVSTGALGFVISFPITACGPGFIGALLGVFYFKEIEGMPNYLYLSLAFVITLFGLIMIALS